MEPLKEPRLRLEADPEDGDEGVKLDLDDESGAFLNAKRKVTKSLYQTLPGLPRRIKPRMFDFLTSQLDRELISHNVMVSDLEKRVREVF